MPLLVACAAMVAVALLLLPDRYFPRKRRLTHHLTRLGLRPVQDSRTRAIRTLPQFRLAGRLPLGWLVALLDRLYSPAFKERFQQRVTYAGLEGQVDWPQFLRLKAAVPVMGLAFMALMYMGNGLDPALVVASPIPFMGFFVPDQWLNGRVKRRQSAIQRELPAVLTTLAITTEAGLHMAAAMEEVVRTNKGELAGQFRWAAEQVALGQPQGHALETMAARCGVPDLTLVVSNLVQSFEKGSGHVAATLRAQAQEAWEQRRRRAEELAQTASVRLFLPLVLLVFPAIIIFLLGPALMTISDFFATGITR